jgi:hypothetical protein
MPRVSHVFVCVHRGERFNPGADLNQSGKIYVSRNISEIFFTKGRDTKCFKVRFDGA